MSDFCQAREQGKRCVAQRGHLGSHDFQPANSLTAQIIERQEQARARMGDVEEAPSTLTKTPEAESAPVTESSAETTPSETTKQETVAEPQDAPDPAPASTTTNSETRSD